VVAVLKVEFVTDLDVRKLAGRQWRLLADFLCIIEDPEPGVSQRLVVVPAGFETDFASVPRLPLAFLMVGDVAHKAPVLHDYLYTVKAGRQFADKAFAAALAAEGIGAARRGLMYAGVRMGGAGHYGGKPPVPLAELLER